MSETPYCPYSFTRFGTACTYPPEFAVKAEGSDRSPTTPCARHLVKAVRAEAGYSPEGRTLVAPVRKDRS